jgi:hypothetical protein
MGYELWTSPTTGYRRRGTRLADLNAAFGKSVCASAIVEPLKSCPADAPAEEMGQILHKRDFDIAGVRTSECAPVTGFVRRIDLTHGLIKDHLRILDAEKVIDESITIQPLLDVLEDRSFVFVRINDEINGIITPADLNKPSVRVYLFGLISLLEIHLSFWVRQRYLDDDWKAVLGPKRITAAANAQAQRFERHQKLDLIQCLQFSDKQKLVVSHDELRQALNLGSKKRANSFLRSAENLRNTLAHSQYDLVGGGSWTELIQLIKRVETTISRSDELVEARANEMADEGIGALW